MSNLEQQFAEAETLRLRAEENKRRKLNGLPSLEQEEIMQKQALREKEEKEKQTLKEAIQNARVQTEQLQGELASLTVQLTNQLHDLTLEMQNLRADIVEVKNLIQDILAKKSDPELRARQMDVLSKLDQYLKNWL